MSWLSNLFGGGRNPADAAQGYLGQIPGAVNPYYQPYINAGQQSMGQTQGIYNQMTQNPNDYYNVLVFVRSPIFPINQPNDAMTAAPNATMFNWWYTTNPILNLTGTPGAASSQYYFCGG